MRNTVAVYRRLLLEAAGLEPASLSARGAELGAWLSRVRPDLVAEAEGMAAGAGVGIEELLAVNARTELLAGSVSGECSVAGVLAGGTVTLAQNWDWHPELAGSRVIWTVRPDGEAGFTTVTEAGILGKVGLSHHGLAVALNFLTSTRDDGLGGMPIHVLLRMVLDSCPTVTAALELLLAARVSASACITVAGAEPGGHSLFAVELSPAGPGLVWPGHDGRLVHTNHFLADPGRAIEGAALREPSTLLRLEHVRSRLRAGESIETVLRSHFPAPHAVCRHDDDHGAWADRRATLLSVVMEPGVRRLEVVDGTPCEHAFEPVPEA